MGEERAEREEVIRLLERDHQDVRRLFGMFDGRAPDIAAELFWILADDLIRHEVAEEVVVYPHLRQGPAPADRGLAEQMAIEQQLTRMETLSTGSPEFADEFAALRRRVGEHIGHEEGELLPNLARTLSVERRRQLGRRYVEVKGTAPNHRYPGATGGTIVGRVAALSDWIRDSASRDLWRASRDLWRAS